MENPGEYGKMLVIIGEKIDVKELPSAEVSMDGKYLSTFKILEIVCGKYAKDTISFIAYDHYGYPGFSRSEHSMLFLSDCDSIVYHHKYMFYDLYKATDGRWASSYHSDDYWRTKTIKPDSIEFAGEVSYNITGLRKSLVREYFPQPYFRITKEKAIAVWGNYVPELFQLKKEGVLTARGYFGVADTGFHFVETEMAELPYENHKVSKKDRAALKGIFSTLRHAVQTRNSKQIINMSLDSIYCSICEGIRDDYYDNELDHIQVYIDSAFEHPADENIWGPGDGRYQMKFYAEIYKTNKPNNFILKQGEKLAIYSIYYYAMEGKSKKYETYKSHHFKFVKINGNFKLYGITSN